MKKYLFLTIVLVFFIIGCGANEMRDLKATVAISRSVVLSYDPTLEVFCENATLDYDKRILTLKGIERIGGNYFSSSGWTTEVTLMNDKMIIHIPADADYSIYIKGQNHFLTAMLSDK